jgi:hypothetical protein
VPLHWLSKFTSLLTDQLRERNFPQAIWEDHVHVMGAFAWSFADNWDFGDYTAQFGIQTVNRTTQERHYKKSLSISSIPLPPERNDRLNDLRTIASR